MTHPSLLPYVNDSGATFRLELTATAGETGAGSLSPRFPFEIISDGGGLSRILSARVTTDAGHLVSPVFLMLSRDDHTPLESALSPLTNADIDSIWKRTFKMHEGQGSLIALSGQVQGSDGPVPFRPLFFCSTAGAFFHPVCPTCGHELDLCRDDEVLQSSGLKSYSASLKRYLACPSCPDTGLQQVFYSSAPGPEDPACVQGPHDLIEGFGRVTSGELPCLRCPERASCFTDGQARARITPVAFYPFHLLMLDAASLNALDYLFLLSGADGPGLEKTLEEERRFARRRFVSLFLENGARKALFSGDEREFLEILSLKLAFLDEAARYLLSGDTGISCPGAAPCLESLWLKMPDQAGLLPGFWTFRLAFMDIDLHDSGILPLQGADYARRVLAVLWFHALLRNRIQDAAAVNRALMPLLNGKTLEPGEEAFSPGNIFWQPGPVPRAWLPLWEKTLHLGASLLESSEPVSAEEFRGSCRELQQEIRKELFAAGPLPVETVEPEEDGKADDERIAAVLGLIRAKWDRAEAKEDLKPAAPAAPVAPDHASETAVASEEAAPGPGVSPAARPIPEPAPQAAQEKEEEYTETVVLNAPRQGAVPQAVEDDFTTETIIVQSVQEIPAQAPPASLDQTVVLGPGPVAAPAPKQEPEHGTDTDDLEATLIMGAGPRSTPKPQETRLAAQDDDGLTETVIMSPGKKN